MSRVQNLLSRLGPYNADGLLVCSTQNVRYLSGFATDDPNVGFAIVGGRRNVLVTDYRFGEQAQTECKDFDVVIRDRQMQSLGECIREVCKAQGIKRLGFEREHFLFGLIEDIRAVEGVDYVPVGLELEVLRRIKDEYEVACIKRAANIGDEALRRLVPKMKPGATESSLARELEANMFELGSEGLSFPTIFLSGTRSSLPHGMPTEKALEDGELVSIDFGAVIEGYRSDMTRTFAIGQADSKQKEVYGVIREAQQTGMDAIRAGVPGKEPYFKVREVLERSRYIEFLGEGLGHCVGLNLHERPFMEAGCDTILEEGFVLTVEPGIYIPGWGGVRIEDDLLVKEDGSEILTQFPRDLMELR